MSVIAVSGATDTKFCEQRPYSEVLRASIM